MSGFYFPLLMNLFICLPQSLTMRSRPRRAKSPERLGSRRRPAPLKSTHEGTRLLRAHHTWLQVSAHQAALLQHRVPWPQQCSFHSAPGRQGPNSYLICFTLLLLLLFSSFLSLFFICSWFVSQGLRLPIIPAFAFSRLRIRTTATIDL